MESIFISLIAIIICICLILFQKINNIPKFCIVQVQNYFWLFGFLLYSFNFIGFVQIKLEVYLLAFIYLVTFNFIYLILGSSNYNVVQFAGCCNKNYRKINLMKIKYSNKYSIIICIIFCIASWILSIPILQKSIPVLFESDLNMLRFKTYGEYSMFSTLEQVIINYIIRPIFNVTLLYNAILIANKEFNLKIFVVALINSFLLVVMVAARSMIFSFVFYIIICLLLFNGANIKRIILTHKKIIIPAVILSIVFINIFTQRINRDNGIFVEFLIYFFGGIPYFSQLTEAVDVSPMLMGRGTFAFIYDTFGFLLRFVGVEINLASQYISNLTSETLLIGNNIYTNATASTLLTFYLDFGTFGVLLSSIIVSLFCFCYERKTYNSPSLIRCSRYLFLIGGMISSIQNYSFGNIATLITWILIGFMLHQRRSRNEYYY